MGNKTKLTATLPDGTVVDRTTAKDYQFVIAVYDNGNGYHDKGWGILGWTTRYDLADKKIRSWQGKVEEFEDFKIVPVDGTDAAAEAVQTDTYKVDSFADNTCQCGCGAEVKRRFLPGHDAKLKSRLLTEAREGSEAAAAELQRRGW